MSWGRLPALSTFRRLPSTHGTIADVVAMAFLLLGLGVRLRAYKFNRSLWLDESMLALNVVDRDLLTLLTTRLDWSQHAPLGFLAATKAATALLGDADWALRLVPFAAGLLLVPLLYMFARRYYDRLTACACTVASGLSVSLIYYSTEFKQYGLDALVTLAVLWMFHRWRSGAEWPAVSAAALAGIAAIVLSHPAVLMLTAVSVVIAARAAYHRQWGDLARLLVCSSLWMLVFVGIYVFSIRSAVHDAELTAFHESSFAPIALTAASLDWYRNAVETMFMFAVDPSLWLLCLVLFGVGSAALWGRHRSVVILCGVNLAILWFASVLGLYPIHQRFLLYLYPLLLLIAGAGAARLLAGPRPMPAVLLLLIFLYPTTADRVKLVSMPRGREEARDLVQLIARDRRSGDGVVVWRMTEPTYRFYSRRGDRAGYVLLKGDPNGRVDSGELRVALKQTRAGRVWVIASHFEVPENLAEIERTLTTETVIQNKWTRPDAVLWYCDIPSSPDGT